MYVLCIIYRIIVILSIVLLQRNKLKVYRNELCNNFTFEKDIILLFLLLFIRHFILT